MSDLSVAAIDGEVGVAGARPEIHSADSLPIAEEVCPRGKQLVFFSVIDGHLARAHRFKVDGQQTLTAVQAITVLPLREFSPSDRSYVESLTSMMLTSGKTKAAEAIAAMTLNPATVSAESLTSMWRWDQQPHMVVHIANHHVLPGGRAHHAPSVLRVCDILLPVESQQIAFVMSSQKLSLSAFLLTLLSLALFG